MSDISHLSLLSWRICGCSNRFSASREVGAEDVSGHVLRVDIEYPELELVT